MATMTWDPEMATIAALNVRQCRMKHDKCRNTDTFKFAGQNLAAQWGRPPPSESKTLTAAINGWFSEWQNANMTYIDKFQSSPKTIGHFTVMVADRNFKVGCGRIKYSKDKGAGMDFLMACNYATTNMLGAPIYKAGKSASKCLTGKNPKYPGLCSVAEKYDVNKF